MASARIGVASISTETNTFAPRACTWDRFSVAEGPDAAARTRGTNSELGGALAALDEAGAVAVPLVYAWAMPNGPVEGHAFDRLLDLLVASLRDTAPPCDGIVLSLHGAMVADGEVDADGALIEAARDVVGPDRPIIVCLDLHANVTARMLAAADAVIGYHTDPHVDQAATGRRAARLAIATVDGRTRPTSALAKRSMIVPAESMNTTTGPLAAIRAEIGARQPPGVVDVSLFPVQPWLDVPELGFGVVVTTDDDATLAADLAESYARAVWDRRHEFHVERLMVPARALAAARESEARPFVIAHSADAPTAGAAGDDATMVAVLAARGQDLSAIVPVVDPAGVAVCHEAGVGAQVSLQVGASIDARWSSPVAVEGVVTGIGDGRYPLEGASFTGVEVSMGRFAVVARGPHALLLSEFGAWTSDPGTYRHAGLDPFDVDVLVVRSCSDFRPNFPASAGDAVTLDVPGAATPRLERLRFERAGRTLWPLHPIGTTP